MGISLVFSLINFSFLSVWTRIICEANMKRTHSERRKVTATTTTTTRSTVRRMRKTANPPALDASRNESDSTPPRPSKRPDPDHPRRTRERLSSIPVRQSAMKKEEDKDTYLSTDSAKCGSDFTTSGPSPGELSSFLPLASRVFRACSEFMLAWHVTLTFFHFEVFQLLQPFHLYILGWQAACELWVAFDEQLAGAFFTRLFIFLTSFSFIICVYSFARPKFISIRILIKMTIKRERLIYLFHQEQHYPSVLGQMIRQSLNPLWSDNNSHSKGL